MLAREQDNFRAALDWSLARGDQAGPRLARALGGFWLGRGLLQEGRDWLERALAQRPADQRLRADLLRLLGAVLFEAGDLERRGHGAVGRLCRLPRRRAHPRCRPGSGSCALTSGTCRARDTPRRWRNARRRRLSWNPKATWTAWPRR